MQSQCSISLTLRNNCMPSQNEVKPKCDVIFKTLFEGYANPGRALRFTSSLATADTTLLWSQTNSTKSTMMALLFFVGLVSPAIAHRKSVKSQCLHCVQLVKLANSKRTKTTSTGTTFATARPVPLHRLRSDLKIKIEYGASFVK